MGQANVSPPSALTAVVHDSADDGIRGTDAGTQVGDSGRDGLPIIIRVELR